MEALVADSAQDGVELSVFGGYQTSGELVSAPAYNNGAQMESEIRPQFEAYFLHEAGDEIWPILQEQPKATIAG
jgi:hypothetical protein